MRRFTRQLLKPSPHKWVPPAGASTSKIPFPNSQEGDVKGSSAEIDKMTVSDGRSGRLVNNTEDIHAGDGPCVLGSMPFGSL